MPLFSIETNQALTSKDTLNKISQAVAKFIGKPESYVMVKYTHNQNMLFAGTNQPLAHVKCKSLGLPEDRTAEYSFSIATLLSEHLNIPSNRIYIEFSNPDRHMWGWDGTTF